MRTLFTLHMMILYVACVIAAAIAHAAPKKSSGVYIQTMAALDDPRGFCFDLSGHPKIDFEAPVQGHTCKEGFDHDDQVFDPVAVRAGQLRLAVLGNRCLSAEKGHVYVRNCDNTPSQRWQLSVGGAIRTAADPSLCVTIGADSSEAGYPELVRPAWLHRDLTVEPCDWHLAARQMWRMVTPVLPIYNGPDVPARRNVPAASTG